MTSGRKKVHFTDQALIGAVNPISVNLIGAGGTGSKVLSGLMDMNHCLTVLGHAGVDVRVWDDDTVEEANVGRQKFALSEVGLHKSVALVNRANRWSGTRWKAETRRFEMDRNGALPDHARATIFISCVDSVDARFGIAEMLDRMTGGKNDRDRPRYWMDFGNSHSSGQVILSTVGEIVQPDSKKYDPVADLPYVTKEFGDLLRASEDADDTPTCSLAESLEKQDLYINSSLASMGCSLLWNMFRYGMVENRGFFHHLGNFNTNALAVG